DKIGMATITPDRWIRPPQGRILAQRQVRARLIVIRRIRIKNSPQVRLAENQHSVQALAAHGADQALRLAILPRRSRRDRSGAEGHGGVYQKSDSAILVMKASKDRS